MRDSQPLYFADKIRALEDAARGAHPGIDLMQRAGFAAAQRARELLGGGRANILVLAGPGNNGGDAFVAARHLRSWSYRVDVVFGSSADYLPADAQRALHALLAEGGATYPALPENALYDLVIDGLFGTGLKRPLEGAYASLVERINGLGVPILALDVPSGLDADTGQVMGRAIRAQHTITFIALKPGLLTLHGPDYRGELSVDTLDLDVEALVAADGHAIGAAHLRGVLPARLKNSHKGSYGSVAVIGGDKGMVGAALLAARAALYTGAGRVYAGIMAPQRPRVDFNQPELMLRSAEQALALEGPQCLVLGPGMGTDEGAADLLRRALPLEHPIVLDADALNLLAQEPALQRAILARRAPVILTPHPAEAARLLGTDTRGVQTNRIDAACRIAVRMGAYVVLKGAGSVCATPDQRWFINATGNPGLASGGMGDVLAGFMGALLAQGAEAEQALLAGVHLHGLAADMLVARDIGPRGLTASELILELRQLVNIH